MKSLSITGMFLILVMTVCTTALCAGWQVPLPETAGIRLYVEKKSYEPGETVRFMLYDHLITSNDHEFFYFYEYTNIKRIPGSKPPQFTADRIEKKIPKGTENPNLGLCSLVGMRTGTGKSHQILDGSYYVIQHKTDQGWRDFFTSKKEPFTKELEVGKGLVWGWDQMDKEETNKAKPGEWRLVFHGRYLDSGDDDKRSVRFTISEKGAKRWK